MELNKKARDAWGKFLNNRYNVGHVERQVQGPNVDAHVLACWESALGTIKRVRGDLPNANPKRILEIGSSTGLNCFAFKKEFPTADVIGVEPEDEAIYTANTMAEQDQSEYAPIFIQGFGEKLPIDDESVDLILCHTVIEHVKDVEQVISEIARVIKSNGYLHIEAPNYVWPYEPHLRIWCVPLLGKRLVRIMGRMQGERDSLDFLDHLQFVTPWQLHKYFKQHNLKWKNRVREKLQRTLDGDSSHIKEYTFLANILGLAAKLRLGKLLINLVLLTGLYPSVLYTVSKTNDI